MKTSILAGHLVTAVAALMLMLSPLLSASPAEAYYRHGAAACGPRGCAAAGCGPRGCAAGATGRYGYRRGGAACGPHGCVAAGSRGYRPGGVVVVNPNRYWRPGGAIAAGAALGFVAGAAAVSVAGTPPHTGLCWYYTSPAKTTGFWDVCPR